MRTATLLVFLLFSPALGIIDVFAIDGKREEKSHHFVTDSSENQIVREDVPQQFQADKNSHNLNTSDIPDVDQVDKNVNEFAEFWNKLKQEQERKYNEFRDKMKQKEQEKLREEQEEVQEFQKFKNFWNKLKQDEEDRYNEFKTKLNEKKEQWKGERRAELEENQQKWEDLKRQVGEKWNNFKENTKKDDPIQTNPRSLLLPSGLSFEQKKQLLGELVEVFEGIRNATKIKKAEEKARRKELRKQLQPAIDEFFTQLRAKIGAWRIANEEEKAQKWAELKAILLTMLQAAEQRKTEKNAALQEFWQSIHDKVTPILEEAGAGATAQPIVKASLLETITGASSWQTVTWVLLALCVALAMALLVLVFYQTTQKQKFLYQQLPGEDSETPSLYPKRELQQAF